MKMKQLSRLAGAAGLSLLICGCTPSGSTVQANTAQAETQEQEVETEAETAATEDAYEHITFGQTATAGDYEFTFTSMEWAEEYTDGPVTWTAEGCGGEVLLLLHATVTNNGACEYNPRLGAPITLTINDKYAVGMTGCTVDAINPLEIKDVVFYFSTSNGIRDAYESGEAAFEVYGATTEETENYYSLAFGNPDIYYPSEILGEYILDM